MTDTAHPIEEVAARFERAPLTRPLFMNSVPKCGTHLLRNILRMFIPAEQQYPNSIQTPTLRTSLAAFDPARPQFGWGHVMFSDDAAVALRGARHLLLVRDPYDWVLASTRFFLSEQLNSPLNQMKAAAVQVEEVMNMMILGIHMKVPSLADFFIHNGAAWTGTHARLLRYEDLTRHLGDLDTAEAEAFFRGLLEDAGLTVPADWRERVRAGADPALSQTARENLSVGYDIPDELPAAQKRLVDFAAPGLRVLLGYA